MRRRIVLEIKIEGNERPCLTPVLREGTLHEWPDACKEIRVQRGGTLKRVLIVRHHRLCRPVWGHIPVQILLNRQGQTGGERVVEACAPLATLRVGVVRIKQHAGTGSKAQP